MNPAPRFKYPRTFHLPYSEKRGDDDKVLASDAHFRGKTVVVTEKMDGENTTIYPDYLHARSIDSDWDESRRWLDRLRIRIAPGLPEGWRICGENLFYKHTIKYTDLDSLFRVYSVWNARNECLSWPDTGQWTTQLGLSLMPVIYAGMYNPDRIREAFDGYLRQSANPVEGFVVRLAGTFAYADFSRSVAKFVRASFDITSVRHWKYDVKELNELKGNRNAWETDH
jgi:hypothetical protein